MKIKMKIFASELPTDKLENKLNSQYQLIKSCSQRKKWTKWPYQQDFRDFLMKIKENNWTPKINFREAVRM
jgi:hypothetical protein